jgi:titin
MSGIPPTAPSSVSCTVIDASHIDVRWTNGSNYTANQPGWLDIERKPDGGGYAQVGQIEYSPGMTCLFQDGSLADGTKYWYRVRFEWTNPESPYEQLYTSYSGEASETTFLSIPTGLNLHSGDDLVYLFWNDESQNESGFEIYRDGALIHTTAANTESYINTGLSRSTKYKYKIRAVNAVMQSGFSAEIETTTGDSPNAPSNLTGYGTTTTRARLNWEDNAENETGFKVYISTNGADFTLHATITTPNIETYLVTGLTSLTHYWFKVYAYNGSGDSWPSNTADLWTLAGISTPTNVQLFPVSGTVLDGTFEDNSELEDDHRLELKVGAGSYSEVLTIAANVTSFRLTGLTAGTTCYVKIRAKQAAAYSAYSAEATTVMLDTPGTPTALAVSEHKDTWIGLVWTAASLICRTVIAKSLNGADYTDIAEIDVGIQEFRATGLTTGAPYWFKVKHKNGKGEGSYCTAVTHTTDASYEPTAFEKLMRRPMAEILWRLKVNPSMVLEGWTLTSGVTYEQTIGERGIDIEAVYENGEAYAEKTSIATVEATAATFWFDYFTRKLYIHTSDGIAPSNYFLTASFWLYFTNWQEAGAETIFNDNYYLPFLKSENIPSISEAIQPYYEGNFTLSMASIALINGVINKQPFFDRLVERYNWLNRKAVLEVGGLDFADADFMPPIRTGIISDWLIDDATFTLNLTDLREGLQCSIPRDQYKIEDFPNMDSNLQDQYRPFGFGTITNAPGKCIDTINRIYEFHNGRIKSVTQVMQNGTALSAGTDYWIDYQRGRVTLAKTLTYQTSDIILIDFIGQVNSCDTAITNGGDIFKYIFNNFLGLDNSELNLDSINETRYARTTALAAYFYKDSGNSGSDNVIKTIEHSIRAYTFQDGWGRIGLRVARTTAPTDIKYVGNTQIFSIAKAQTRESLYGRVHVHYNENPQTERYQWINKTLNVLNWKYGPQGDESTSENLQQLDIYTYLPTEADANLLGDEIVDLLEKKVVSLETSGILYPCQAGDLFYLSRNRYYDSAGTANNKLMRIISITKQAGNRRCSITAEEVET